MRSQVEAVANFCSSPHRNLSFNGSLKPSRGTDAAPVKNAKTVEREIMVLSPE